MLSATLSVVTVDPAFANDLGDAVDFAQKHLNRDAKRNFERQWRERSRHEAMGMLSSRNIEHRRPLYEYDCINTGIDTVPSVRSSGKEKTALRRCLEKRFDRDHLPDYRTLGTVRLDESHVREAIETNAAATEVPAIVLDTIIKLKSGYRPHAVSVEGHIGLMQLRPKFLREEGIAHGDLMDPEENIRAGALYLRALVYKHGSVRSALLAYPDGGADMTYRNRMKRWFVGFTVATMYSFDRKFPYKLGAENMTFVWTWLE